MGATVERRYFGRITEKTILQKPLRLSAGNSFHNYSVVNLDSPFLRLLGLFVESLNIDGDLSQEVSDT